MSVISLSEEVNTVLRIPSIALTSAHLSALILATHVYSCMPLTSIDGNTRRLICFTSLAIVNLLTIDTQMQVSL